METLLEIRNLKTYFFLDHGTVHAVDGVSCDLHRGRTLGMVGESGCGKSVTARSILRIVGARGRIVEGKILLHGEGEAGIDLTAMDPKGREIRAIRGKTIAMIFQEPMTSLSPVYTIGNQIMEAILLHQHTGKKEARELAIEMLWKVGISKPRQRVDEYPHQLSGGMRQRAMIAMALSCRPKLLIADEPTTALDVTIQAQILDLMRNLKDEFGMAILMITHNLGVIAEMAEEVAVMYLGRLVEEASSDDLFYDPRHPYTRALLRSIPKVGKKSGVPLESIRGVVPDPLNVPRGCPFHPRCRSFLRGTCEKSIPPLLEIAPGHRVACHLFVKEGIAHA
ncbi:MAG TPA: ABC transporter ATP-binding protein [Spirochaetia bacterium]|nr:ABC transporter ATP-binding protein [Spirochaetia bacterium]